MDLRKSLKEEASDLLHKQGVHDMLSSYGEVLYAGSYATDMLCWRDIDLNIIVEKEKQKDVCARILRDLLDRKDVTRFRVIADLRKKYGNVMPDSIYVGLKISSWKFDVHILDKSESEITKEKTQRVLDALTDEKKERIMFYKEELVKKYGRSPKFASFNLYEAILFEGLDAREEVYNYLRHKGVDV